MSGRARVILIAGWAQSGQVLAPLAGIVFPGGPPATTTSVSSLLVASQGQETPAAVDSPSVYATALAAQLGEKEHASTLIGWSMGGMVALETAIYFPELVRRLVLISSCARFDPPVTDGRGLPSLPVRALIRGMHRDRQETLRRFFSLVYSEGSPAPLLEESLHRALELDPDYLVHGLRYIQGIDLRARLCEVRIPALIIHGRRDRVIGSQASQLLHAGISGSELLLVDEGDHGLITTDLEAVTPAITRFLNADPLRA